MHALIASGAGRYADPWHPLTETSAALARVLEADGWTTRVSLDVDAALQQLSGVDLLVVNAADPWRNGETGFGAPEAAQAGLAGAIDRGIGILCMHSAVTSLRDYAPWAAAVGAVWLPTISGHPPIGPATITPRQSELTAGLEPFELVDERYLDLQFIGEHTPVADNDADGRRYPVAWVRTHGPARVAVDLLGHDPRSYEAVGHVELIQRLARWAGARDND